MLSQVMALVSRVNMSQRKSESTQYIYNPFKPVQNRILILCLNILIRYFESAEDELANSKKLKDLEYQPASDSSESSESDEEDPLDSFMSSIEV